jgi:hypothetical protein
MPKKYEREKSGMIAYETGFASASVKNFFPLDHGDPTPDLFIENLAQLAFQTPALFLE